MVWVIAFGELFFGDLWCVVWGYGGMRTHFSLLNLRLPSFSGHPISADLVSVGEDVHCESTAQEVHAGVPA